jgi:hypothetical protein
MDDITEASEPAQASQPAQAPSLPLGTAGTRKPIGLIVLLLLALAAAGWLGFYAQQLVDERAHTRVELAAQERKILDLREQLTRAEVAIQEKEAALASRDSALADATQPELPVRVSFRPAWMGQGMVASFRNVATQQLTLMVEFRDSNLKTSRDFALVVDAGATAEVGHPQGWLVSSGQSVRVSASGFKSVTAFAP